MSHDDRVLYFCVFILCNVFTCLSLLLLVFLCLQILQHTKISFLNVCVGVPGTSWLTLPLYTFSCVFSASSLVGGSISSAFSSSLGNCYGNCHLLGLFLAFFLISSAFLASRHEFWGCPICRFIQHLNVVFSKSRNCVEHFFLSVKRI